jgi:exopolysaccharide biosynthesis polyprenyl glycosylphosphotransferase
MSHVPTMRHTRSRSLPSVPPFGETATSTIETQQANGGSLATALPGVGVHSGRRARRHASWRWMSVATDVVTLALALFLDHLTSEAMPVASTFVFAALVIRLLASKGMYRPPIDLRMLDAIRSIVGAVAIAAALTIALRAVLTDASAIAEEMIEPWLVSTAFVVGGRVWLISSERRARRKGRAGQRALIVGAGNVGRLVAWRLRERPEMGLKPIGFLDKDPLHGAEATGLPVLGASWDLDRIVRDEQVDHVIVTFSTAPDEVHLRLLKRCDQLGIATTLVPRLFEKSTEHVTVVPLGGVPLIARHLPNPRSWQFAVKHGLDRAGAALALLFLAPLMGALALGVLATLGRPILYRAKRVGRDGRRFDMLKFRTMLPMTEDELTNLVIDPETGTGGVGSNGVDRRTRLGAFMRRTSLDELPQLFNVLTGEMSLVGPRPERTEYVEVYEMKVPRYAERHRVKQGITGWAQVSGLRGTTSLADRAEWDNYYIENWSLWLDFKIMLMTLRTVVRSAEAASSAPAAAQRAKMIRGVLGSRADGRS